MIFKQSSEVFKGDLDILDSLDSEASRRLFVGLSERKPTLEMALREAGIKDYDIILEDSRIYADAARENPEIAKLGLSDDEAGAISCYTLEGIADAKSPYQVINEGLAGSRSRVGLARTRRLLFLLLSGLRKLPRTRPSAGQIFYRGIRAKVPQTENEANGHQYYKKGRTVTWWGFTSTTTSMKTANDFIEDAPESTLFNIGGEDLWGYDIKAFSQYPKEEEILLEPEAKVFVKDSMKYRTLSIIEVILQPFDHLALEGIIPVGKASPVPTQIDLPPAVKANLGGSFSIVHGKSAFSEQTSNVKKWNCEWKECPDYVKWSMKYDVDGRDPKIATKINDEENCTIIGNTPLPPNAVTSWSVKILNSEDNDGGAILIGVAPFDINQNNKANFKCGWYFDCYRSILWSGPPHNYGLKGIGQWKEGDGEYVHNGDSVGVVMDTAKGKLSFSLNGANLGLTFEGIPLSKPLVPCVILSCEDDSVKLII